jgi:hypothetical protein
MHSRYMLFETYLPDFPCEFFFFSLYYAAMDIVAKEEWTSDCSYRCYIAISFSALLMLILIWKGVSAG